MISIPEAAIFAAILVGGTPLAYLALSAIGRTIRRRRDHRTIKRRLEGLR